MLGIVGKISDRGKTPGREWDRRLLWILGAGAIVRLILFYFLRDIELWMDEKQYQEIAVNLVKGTGFALDGELTSWRPPLYPFLLSGLYALTGTTDPLVARAFQAVLSLATSVVVYMLGRRLFGEKAGLGAALLFTFYPSFLFYNNHILTEVLFTFLLTLTAYWFLAYLQSGRLPLLAASGFSLGLTVLSRDMIWPMVGLMSLLVWHGRRLSFSLWVGHSVVLAVSFLVVVTPWIIRNSRVQGTFTLVSTNGGPVFYAGNYEHTPLDRPWRSHALDTELKVRHLLPPDLSEGERQKIAFHRGLEFIWNHPGLTLHRSLIKAANVWGLEREVVGVSLKGAYGKLGKIGILAITASIFGAYVVTILSGMTGLGFAFAKDQETAFHALFASLLLFITLAHALTSGHPRYHLPFIPLFSAYAARAWSIRREVWQGRQSWPFRAAFSLALLLSVVWIREIFFVEFDRFIGGLR